jgi:hypothetical protein
MKPKVLQMIQMKMAVSIFKEMLACDLPNELSTPKKLSHLERRSLMTLNGWGMPRLQNLGNDEYW